MRNDKDNIILNQSLEFALEIIKYCELLDEHKKYIISKQLLRSGTSIGANIREAQNAQSKADFIHKLSISQKECDESLYWMELLYQSEYLHKEDFDSIYFEDNELLKMLRSAIIT